jgi:hypothetical protein
MTKAILFELNQSDPVETNSASRSEFESDILNRGRSEVQEAILHTAPESWSRDRCEAVEEAVLADTRLIQQGGMRRGA